jgi:chondroitin AC lyase
MKIFKLTFLSVLFLLGIILAFASKQKSLSISRPIVSQFNANNILRAHSKSAVQTQTSILVIADTYLDGPNGTTNNGSNNQMTIKYTNSTSNTYNRISLLKFNLQDIDQSKGRIVKAELQLFIKSTDAMNSATKRQNFDDTPYIISYSKEDSWNETAVTWNNYAGYAQSAAETDRILGNTIPYTQVNATNWAIVANSQVTWNITDALRKDYLNDSGQLLSLTLSSTAVAANMGATFHTRENGNLAYVPRIVIYQDSDIPFTLPSDTEPTVYTKILDNISKVLYDEVSNYNTISSQAQGHLNSINPNGSWSDLTYTGDVPTNHLDRLKTMALAYTNNQSSLYADVTLYSAIVNGLQYWYNQNPDHSNWFYDQIAYPQRIGQILILMRNGVQKTPIMLELNTLSRMKSNGGAPDQGGSQGTGANKMNIAMHWIYRACLAEDKNVLDKGVEQAFYPLFLTNGEGLQHDYSYLQHGLQLYIGGYGWDIVNGMTGVALYTVGTPYSLANEKLDYLSGFVRQAYLRVIRGQNFMFNAFGRGISRENGANQSGFATLLNRMKVVDPTFATTYDMAIERLTNNQPASYGVEVAHTHFYSSDYTLLTKPKYTFELRAVSTRTLRNENGNGENIKGYFLADGATSIAITGTEYVNIYPMWNWSMIPGTTARNGTMVTPAQWGTAGTTTFVGGVSDTTRGVSVYDLNNNSTQAKKAWFFFDDEVVCLGAGINATGTQEVNTTLNQCLLQSEVTTSTTDGVVNTYNGNSTTLNYTDNLEWAIQGNVGYVLPNGGNIGLTAQPRTGTWRSINGDGSTANVTKDVFTLWVKHGINPNNGNYAYIVVPNISTAIQMQNYTAQNNIQILQNTNLIQAVRHKTSNLHSFVFHAQNQTFANDTISVSTDQPCLLMVQPLANGKLKLNISDPTKTLSTITVNIKWPSLNSTKQMNISLPDGVYKGKSAVAMIASDVTVLPLKILSFSAKRTLNAVDLKWTSTNEINTSAIEILRREKENGFTSIGKIRPVNHPTTINHYALVDDKAGPNELYYQLKIIDKDGEVTFSDMVSVSRSAMTAVSIYPNPVATKLYIKNATELLKVYNSIGALMTKKEIIDGNDHVLDVTGYPNGVYYLKTIDRTIKFMVVK